MLQTFQQILSGLVAALIALQGVVAGIPARTQLAQVAQSSFNPVISNAAVINITQTSAEVDWQTNIPTTSQLGREDQADANTPLAQLPEITALTTNHSYVITNLKPGTTYRYYIIVGDGGGNKFGTWNGSNGIAPLDFTTLALDTNTSFDYHIDTIGPKNIYAGSDLLIKLRGYAVSGTGGHLYFENLQGAPAGATFSFVCDNTQIAASKPCYYDSVLKKYYQWNGALGPGAIFYAKVATSPSTSPGTYTLSATFTSMGVQKLWQYTFTVLPTPAVVTPATFSSAPPVIPGLAMWEELMVRYGQKWCDPNEIIPFGYEGDVWYYDGGRVYFQIYDQTGNQRYLDCAKNILTQYRDRIISRGGSYEGWRVFPQGLYMNYTRYGDDLSKQADILLSQKSAFAGTGGDADPIFIRETAYIINAYVFAEKLGQPRNPNLAVAVNFGLGQFDRLFTSAVNQDVNQTFCDGLMAEALINYYEQTQDPRIPTTIKKLLDWEWANGWNTSLSRLVYNPVAVPQMFDNTDANLIVPAWAWYWHLTGDNTYLQEGDTIFQHALDQYIGDKGKTFSQNYKWSFDYIKWRSSGFASAKPTAFPDMQAPTAPSNLRAEFPSDGRVRIDYNASTDNFAVSSYQFYRDDILQSQVWPDTPFSIFYTLFDDKTYTPGGTYRYRVTALDGSDNATPSAKVLVVNTATKTTSLEDYNSSTPPSTPPVAPPSATSPTISSFVATPSAITKGQSVTLSWSASGNPAPTLSIDQGIGNVSSFSYYTLSPQTTTTYTLTATNSAGAVTKSVSVTVNQPTNTAPTVTAGSDQFVTLPGTVPLSGIATDDGLPNGTLLYSWSKTSGPGDVTFSNPNSKSTTVSFSAAGTYVLRLSAYDSLLSSYDELTVTVSPASVQSQLMAEPSSGSWYGTYSYRKTLTVDHNKVTASLSAFPLLVSVTDTDLRSISNGGKVQSSSGYDISFTDSNNNKLPFEIEKYDPSAGTLIVWVKTDLSSTANTSLYLYFGDSSVTSTQQDVTNVWNGGYKGVWHFAGGTTNDSTSQNISTNYGTTAGAGQIGTAAISSGSPNYFDTGISASTMSAHTGTMSVWFDANSTNSYGPLVANDGSSYGTDMTFLGSNGYIYVAFSNGTSNNNFHSNGAVASNTWHNATLSWDGSRLQLYLDGVLNNSATQTIDPVATSTVVLFAHKTTPNYYFYKGALDEVRVSSMVRSVDWIRTEYNNQSSPSTFETLATLETNSGGSGGGGGVSSPTNTAPTVNAGPDQSVTLPATASLSGIATDDGLPTGSTLSYSWSEVSGPGTVTFDNPSSRNTSATFSANGTYTLRLSVSDSALSSYDDISVAVNPIANQTQNPPSGGGTVPYIPPAYFGGEGGGSFGGGGSGSASVSQIFGTTGTTTTPTTTGMTLDQLRALIASLLQQIATLQARLSTLKGGTTTGTTGTTGTTTFTRPLSLGSTGPDVKLLQTFLQSKGYLPSTLTPTTYFGSLTRSALQKFQCDSAIVCSGSESSTGYGVLGARTRAVMK